MDDVPAAADSGELIVLRVVLCAGGKTPASGESPVPVPSSFPATWNLEGTSVAESKTFWEISQPPVREGGGSVGGLQNSQIRYYEAVSGVVNTFHVMRISQ